MKVQKAKWINLGILLSSLLGFLEWGGNNQSFLFQSEWEIIYKSFQDDRHLMHPLILLPLLGQVLLIISLFQKKVSRSLTYTAISCLGMLLGFIFIIGLFDFHFKILSSTFPFFFFVFLAIREHRRGMA